jgi:SAM-dependent methyltransferase
MNFRFLSYELNDLAQNSQIRLPEFYMSAAAKKTAYPIRAIRYWWVCQALSHKLIDKPDATIVDMGAGHGQMRRYCAGSMPCLSPEYPFGSQHWIGLDKAPQAELSTAGYDQIVECDFDKPLPLQSSSADALICIHVMEHLPRPEFTMSEIARVLAPGGIFCSGSPTAPGPFSFLFHRWLRYKMRSGSTGPNGHINSFSPNDWKRLVANAGLKLDFLSGSHLMRLSGSSVENSKTWAKLNLFWGGLFPSLGSEVYLQAHKEA